jgi:hypothetical protein
VPPLLSAVKELSAPSEMLTSVRPFPQPITFEPEPTLFSWRLNVSVRAGIVLAEPLLAS